VTTHDIANAVASDFTRSHRYTFDWGRETRVTDVYFKGVKIGEYSGLGPIENMLGIPRYTAADQFSRIIREFVAKHKAAAELNQHRQKLPAAHKKALRTARDERVRRRRE
jgi:hypothetical protein